MNLSPPRKNSKVKNSMLENNNESNEISSKPRTRRLSKNEALTPAPEYKDKVMANKGLIRSKT